MCVDLDLDPDLDMYNKAMHSTMDRPGQQIVVMTQVGACVCVDLDLDPDLGMYNEACLRCDVCVRGCPRS